LNALASGSRVAALAAAAVIPPLHEFRRIGTAPGRPPVTALVLTLFAPVAAVLLLRPGRLAVTRGSIVTMTMAVGAVLTIAAAGVLAFAMMRPIRMVAIVPPLLPFTLWARADAERGIPFHDDIVRLAMASVVGMARCRGTGAAVAITVTVGPTVLFLSLTAMPAVATAIVMTAAVGCRLRAFPAALGRAALAT
jgi:hypothetical protein